MIFCKECENDKFEYESGVEICTNCGLEKIVDLNPFQNRKFTSQQKSVKNTIFQNLQTIVDEGDQFEKNVRKNLETFESLDKKAVILGTFLSEKGNKTSISELKKKYKVHTKKLSKTFRHLNVGLICEESYETIQKLKESGCHVRPKTLSTMKGCTTTQQEAKKILKSKKSFQHIKKSNIVESYLDVLSKQGIDCIHLKEKSQKLFESLSKVDNDKSSHAIASIYTLLSSDLKQKNQKMTRKNFCYYIGNITPPTLKVVLDKYAEIIHQQMS